jgi:hypothetical protein
VGFLLLVLGGAFAILMLGLAAVKVLFGLVLLPFKLVGALLKAVVGVIAGVFGALATGGVALAGVLVVLVAVVLLPLLPIIAFFGLIWLAIKAMRPSVRTAH